MRPDLVGAVRGDRRRGGGQGALGRRRWIAEILNADRRPRGARRRRRLGARGLLRGCDRSDLGVSRTWRRASAPSCHRAVRSRAPRRRGQVHGRPAAPRRLDMGPKLVAESLQGGDGPRRARRAALPPAAARAELTGRAARGRGGGEGRWRGVAATAAGSPAVDSNTEGMPTRVITGGIGPISGTSMLSSEASFRGALDDLLASADARAAWSRRHVRRDSSAAELLDDADWGVVFIEVSAACRCAGTWTIGVATSSLRPGMVEVREPETPVRLDTPAGAVEARVAVEGGRGRSVSLRNVPSVPAGARAQRAR